MPVCFSPGAGRPPRPCRPGPSATVRPGTDGADGGGRTRDLGARAGHGPGGRPGVPGAAGPLLLPIPGRAAGIKQAAEPERFLISGRQLLGITLTEWFCLPAFSTVRRPRAMDQRRGGGSGVARGGGGGGAAARIWPEPPLPPIPLPAPTPAPSLVVRVPQNLRAAQPLSSALASCTGPRDARNWERRNGKGAGGAGRGRGRRKKRCSRGNRDLRQELEKNDRLRRREWEGGLDLRDGRREKKEV